VSGLCFITIFHIYLTASSFRLGQVEKITPVPWVSTVPIDPKPVATFIFKYKPLGIDSYCEILILAIHLCQIIRFACGGWHS
jgi:hypothetical protein